MRCKVVGCKNEEDYVYYDKPVCERCFTKHCNGRIKLKELLKIRD